MKSPLWKIAGDFIIHIFCGTVLFIVIAGAAVGLDYFLKGIKDLETGNIIPYVLEGVKYLVFTVDVILYCIFLIRIGWKTGNEIWYYEKIK